MVQRNMAGIIEDDLHVISDTGEQNPLDRCTLWLVRFISTGEEVKWTRAQIINRLIRTGSKTVDYYRSLGRPNQKYVKGDVDGEFTIIRKTNKRHPNGSFFYEVQCSCGVIDEMIPTLIQFRRKCGRHHEYNLTLTPEQKAAGLLRKGEWKDERQIYKGEFCPSHIWCYYGDAERGEQARAKRQGRIPQFEFSVDEYMNVAIGDCYYCGDTNPKLLKSIGEGDEDILVCGVDRIDSSKGYIKGNVRTCCWHCNRMKADYSEDIFLDKVKAVAEHNQHSTPTIITKLTEADQERIKRVFYDVKSKVLNGKRTSLFNEKDFKNLMVQSCYYCGTERSIVEKGKSKGELTLNGVDRIDSSKGYKPSNTVPCCIMCNNMKVDFSVQDYLNQVKKVYLHLGLWKN